MVDISDWIVIDYREGQKEWIDTDPVSSGRYSEILLQGKILVESVPIWCRIEIYYF
jgi:hypothetical protein